MISPRLRPGTPGVSVQRLVALLRKSSVRPFLTSSFGLARRAALLFALGVPAAPVAHAQGTAPAATTAPLGESLKGEALKAYNDGKLLFGDGDASGAIAKFRRAHELSKDARLLWNMAVCEKELRHYASAARLVGDYLAEAKNLSAESRSNAEQTREALRGFYSELTLAGVPAGARVTVDGLSAGTAPFRGPLPIDLGRRRVRVELEGFEPFERQIDVPGATPITLPVELVKLRNTSTLSVASTGARDVISVDGKVVASGHWQGTLPQGPHAVRVTAPGKKPYEAQLELLANSSKSLQVALEDERKGVPLWAWVAGGAAVAAGAGIGGYFLFRADERERETPRGQLGTVILPASFR